VANRAITLFLGAVLDLGLCQAFLHILVADKTKILAFSEKHILEVCSMGVVALVARLGGRLVLVLELELRPAVQVAEETKIGSLKLYQALKLRGVRIMTDVTVTSGHGAVHHVLGGLVVLVAGETELAGGLLGELLFGVGLMGIMADDTDTLLDGSMDHRHVVVGLVAEVAKGLALGRQLEIFSHLLGGVLGVAVLVTDSALAHPDRAVHELGVPHGSVTFFSNTPLHSVCRLYSDYDGGHHHYDRENTGNPLHAAPPRQ
jgi:hypothetical protein